MKKLLLALPLIAGTSWAGTSYYAGSATKDAYADLLEQLNAFKPFTLVNEEYNAGLARSTAVTIVKASSAPDAKTLFRLQHDINHSPVGLDGSGVRVGAATIKTVLLMPEISSDSILKGFSSDEPVVINTDVQFDGTTTHHLLVSAFAADQDGKSLSFEGLDYTTVVKGKAITGSGTTGSFIVDTLTASFNVSPGAIDVDLEKFAAGVYSGSYGIKFNDVSVESDAIPFDVDAQELSFSSNSKINGKTFNSDMNISVANIDSPLPINNASITGGTKNISIEGMSTYLNTLSKFSALEHDDFSSNPEFINQWKNAMLGLLGPKAGLTYGIDINNDGGNAALNFDVSIIDSSSPNYPQEGLGALTTVRDLFNITEAKLSFEADAAAVDQTPLAGLMNSPQAQQYVLADGLTYQSVVKVKDLIVDVNGNPLSLEMLIAELLDKPLTTLADI
jgi:uncharacterized protein YdgA (DUF945 family)